jgi:hypothetical protein
MRGFFLQRLFIGVQPFDAVNFDVPNRIAFTPNFWRIFGAQPARQMQFGVKLLF